MHGWVGVDFLFLIFDEERDLRFEIWILLFLVAGFFAVEELLVCPVMMGHLLLASQLRC